MIWASFILGVSVIAFVFTALTIIDKLVFRRQLRKLRDDASQYWTDARSLDAYEQDRQAEADGSDGDENTHNDLH